MHPKVCSVNFECASHSSYHDDYGKSDVYHPSHWIRTVRGRGKHSKAPLRMQDASPLSLIAELELKLELALGACSVITESQLEMVDYSRRLIAIFPAETLLHALIPTGTGLRIQVITVSTVNGQE